MLYISRVISGLYYGVVDTDDGVEEQVTKSMLFKLIKMVHIEGVEVDANQTLRVRVQQDPKYATLRQTKALSVLGIEMTLYRDEITAMIIHPGKPVTLRLSDYAKSMSGYLQFTFDGNRKVTFICDDSFNFSSVNAVVYASNICFDVSEMKTDDLAESIYRCFIVGGIDPRTWSEYVKDRQDRFVKWSYIGYVNTSDVEKAAGVRQLDKYGMKSEAAEIIEDMYYWEWAELSSVELKYVQSAYEWLCTTGRWPETQDFEEVKKRFRDIYDVLRLLALSNNRTITSLRNYVLFFDVSEPVKQLCIELHNRVVRSLKEFRNAVH